MGSYHSYCVLHQERTAGHLVEARSWEHALAVLGRQETAFLTLVAVAATPVSGVQPLISYESYIPEPLQGGDGDHYRRLVHFPRTGKFLLPNCKGQYIKPELGRFGVRLAMVSAPRPPKRH